MLVLPIGIPGRLFCFLLRLLRSHFGLCIKLRSLCVGAVPCHMFAASECSGYRRRIVRQCREIDLHNAMMVTHIVVSQPITPA